MPVGTLQQQKEGLIQDARRVLAGEAFYRPTNRQVDRMDEYLYHVVRKTSDGWRAGSLLEALDALLVKINAMHSMRGMGHKREERELIILVAFVRQLKSRRIQLSIEEGVTVLRANTRKQSGPASTRRRREQKPVRRPSQVRIPA